MNTTCRHGLTAHSGCECHEAGWAARLDQERAEVQTLRQEVSHWRHEAERFKEALTLAQQDFKRVTAQRDQAHAEIARLDGEPLDVIQVKKTRR